MDVKLAVFFEIFKTSFMDGLVEGRVPIQMSDSVKFSIWNEVSSHVISNNCSLFRYILITRNEATKPIIQASNLDEGLVEFWSLKLQLGMFRDGLLAQRRIVQEAAAICIIFEFI